ncbi:MAG: nitronate monooxygenase family protein [Roseburia sp.]|nr:nitronate monooxygenase family protein [Roseburia sp.]
MSLLKIGERENKVDVVQGGMGVGISLSGLAGEVAREGGIGILSAAQIGYREPDYETDALKANLRAVKSELHKAKEYAPEGIIGMNIMVATSDYEQYVRAAVEAKADLIVSGAGLPMELPKLVKDSGVKIAPIVSSLRSVRVITDYWWKKYRTLPDMVVIEGPEAGGHLGFHREELQKLLTGNPRENYDAFVQEIIGYIRELEQKRQKKIPVVVGGGIYHREEGEHYRKMGADGVQLGTRFVTTYECDASMAYKKAYIDARKEDIVIVDSPVGLPGRAIRNAFLERVSNGERFFGSCRKCIRMCNPATSPYCIAQALIRAVEGDVSEGLLFCGAGAYQADHLEHVSDILREFGEK